MRCHSQLPCSVCTRLQVDAEWQQHEFDGHVTHAEHCGGGRVVCVNFCAWRGDRTKG